MTAPPIAASPVRVGPAVDRSATDRRAVRVVGLGLVLAVVLQRLAVPVGEQGVSLLLPLGYGILAILLGLRAVQPDRTRTMLFLLAAGACGLAAWSATWRSSPIASMSFLLLVTAYVPWLFRLRGPRRSHHTTLEIGRLFVRLMTVAAAVALAQQVAQRAGGWRFQDYLADLVPEQLLLGDYNTVIPIEYGSPIVKSQAFVFLEPSFLSQYLALGILVAVLIRAPLWQPLLMGVGMVTTFSGTGIVLLIAGGVLVLLRSPRSLRPTLVAGVVLVGGVLLSTSLVAPLADRTQETSESTSSWSLRFVVPYREVVHGLAEAPERYLVGAGPGTSERLLENDKEGAGLAVVYPVAPKLVFEYGLPAGLLFLAFWLVALLRRASMPVVPGALVVMLGALSGSLLQPHTLVLAWLLSLVLAHE